MGGRLDEWTNDGCMERWVGGWIDGQKDGWLV